MKKFLLVASLFISLFCSGQQYFGNTIPAKLDSMKKFNARFNRLNPLDWQLNLRSNTFNAGVLQVLDSTGRKDTLSNRVKGMIFEQANPQKIYANPKAAGVMSVAELRQVTGLATKDTSFHWRVSNSSRRFIQDY